MATQVAVAPTPYDTSLRPQRPICDARFFLSLPPWTAILSIRGGVSRSLLVNRPCSVLGSQRLVAWLERHQCARSQPRSKRFVPLA